MTLSVSVAPSIGKQVTTLIFDLGGVLIDVDLDRGLQKLKNSFSEIERKRLLEWLIHSDTALAYELGQIDDFEFYQKIPFTYLSKLTFDQFQCAWTKIFLPISCTIEILTALSGHYRMAALSNTNHMHIQYLSSHYPFFVHFDKTYYSHELHLRKPDPGIYKYALDDLQVRPEETAFIDDKLENVIAAQQLGMTGMLYAGDCRIRTGIKLDNHTTLQTLFEFE